jgi:GGDEF domain-containing protein
MSRKSSISSCVIRSSALVGGEDSLSVSVGQAFYPADGVDADQLIAEADDSMYKVKKARCPKLRDSQSKVGSAETGRYVC